MLILIAAVGFTTLALKSYLARGDSDTLDRLMVVGGFEWDWEMDRNGRIVSLSYFGDRYTSKCTWELAKLTELKSLSVGDTNLSVYSIETLLSMDQFEYLDLGNTELTEAQLVEFRARNPKCKLVWKKRE
ncbi:hypothetical protein C5Y96_00035 [Blastopirellula marina]|uniref:Leucine Rich repeats (2 copies) n=1 Tax=Blastopirellula marina TaxID=124 RepID=A0A2S8GBG3_9BACT|nr:hypothetical protein C5Y96_00035 [Blastopirellula marina]RCS56350.1 hypothetical protein DTL36_00035 [Bremerella cremea]